MPDSILGVLPADVDRQWFFQRKLFTFSASEAYAYQKAATSFFSGDCNVFYQDPDDPLLFFRGGRRSIPYIRDLLCQGKYIFFLFCRWCPWLFGAVDGIVLFCFFQIFEFLVPVGFQSPDNKTIFWVCQLKLPFSTVSFILGTFNGELPLSVRQLVTVFYVMHDLQGKFEF